ncbi:hypothetical protein CAOG_09186 [Capsaspora owczarzaki ATCC 30864]|uniref:Uncharacterized protein n=1 Tax=Capsaspora owczarzaki (strain ATCC 30864) TaxID=595528 RepID=A0A0D2WYT6_CAPO3|nr:hypothetical protein CAOG_09186 [Capsaspora owczarzaki ATCC 30864]KJE98228.1 hypothetical protein CAOG_009186 [Capsaspora owczarzaki ATCC 30864]|eukprot:XP_011270903.1 hypothetical protein CAOG_09186 [Capsaspora owczarzaki ATCC 30864]
MHVVLHFDVNKTVVMDDAAGSKDFIDILNEVLAESCWGRVALNGRGAPTSADPATDPAPPASSPKRKSSRTESMAKAAEVAPVASTWTILADCEIQSESPEPDNPAVMNYSDYVHKILYPMSEIRKDDASPQDFEAQLADTKATKLKRAELITRFTQRGQPGHALASKIEELDAALTASASSSSLSPESDATAPRRITRKRAHEPERYVLVPAFLDLLVFLDKHRLFHSQAPAELDAGGNDPRGTTFSIAFRTFGDDIQRIIQDLNRFCEGRHPMYPQVRLDGSNGSADLRILNNDAVGCFYRCGPSSDDSYLIQGTIEKPPRMAAGIQHYADNHPGLPVIQGFAAIHAAIGALVCTHSCIALRDYFEWWSANRESISSGKLLLVGDDLPFESMFFDDNFRDDEKGHIKNIVDVRDMATEEAVHVSESINRHVFTVKPFGVITDRRYFIRRVCQRFDLTNVA